MLAVVYVCIDLIHDWREQARSAQNHKLLRIPLVVTAPPAMADSKHKYHNMSIDKRINAVHKQVTRAIKSALAGDISPVTFRDDSIEVLIEADLIYTAVINSSELGVHPENRGRTGVQPDKVMDKVSKFYNGVFIHRVLKRHCG